MIKKLSLGKWRRKIIKNKKHKEYKRSFTEKIERHNKKKKVFHLKVEKPKDYAILLTFRPILFIMGNFQILQYLTTKYVSIFFLKRKKTPSGI